MSRENKKTNEKNVEKLNGTIRASLDNFRPPEKMTVSEWSDKYRKLSRENSAESGRWKTGRTPYLKEVMDSFTDPKIHRITLVASSQVGKTECELNMLGYLIDKDPGGVLFIMPNVEEAKKISIRRLAPMIRDTVPLRKKIAENKSRDGNNTILNKSYPGGLLTIVGANAPAALASTPARYIFGDERDRWTKDAGGEGDPWKLAEARTITFYNKKLVEVSSPTIKDDSEILKSFELGTQEYWCAECPHCHEYVFVKFENVMFEYDSVKINHRTQYSVTKVEFACPECGCVSREVEIKKQSHRWIAKNPEAYKKGRRSFRINAFSSPWVSWKDLIQEYLDAKGDIEKLKTVYNTKFGEPWDNELYVDEDEDEWLKRREEYEAELPSGVLCLTCGVDTQDNRLEYEVVGYGFENETWGIERGIIIGQPSELDVWERLDGVIDKVYRFKDGKGLKISITFVDAGGHYTQDVKEQCAKRLNKKVFAIFGKCGENRPYTDVPKKSKIIKEDRVIGEAWYYIVGVDSGKVKIMAALLDEKEKKCHFPNNPEKKYTKSFFKGLISERMTYKNKKWSWEIIPGHNRNEALDCRNYANAAFDALKPNLYALQRKLNDIPLKKQPIIVKKKQKKRGFDYTDEW